jgi:hypothetical protein
MSKKLFISLVSVAAVAAFAVMPVVAQAAVPRWYSNGTEVKATPVPIVSWGGSTNLSQTSNIGEINCRGVGGGTIKNPASATAPGEGLSAESTFFECKSAGCEAAAKEDGIPLTSYAITLDGTGAPEGRPLAWKNVLTGGPAPEIGETIGEPFSGTFGAPTPGEIVADVNCETPPGFSPHIVGVAAKFEGELNPKIVNGASAGSKPSQAEFKGAATGALHSEIGGEGTNSGKVKFEGYNGQELITAEG